MPVFYSGNIGLIFKLIEKNITAGGKFIVFPLSVVNYPEESRKPTLFRGGMNALKYSHG